MKNAKPIKKTRGNRIYAWKSKAWQRTHRNVKGKSLLKQAAAFFAKGID